MVHFSGQMASKLYPTGSNNEWDTTTAGNKQVLPIRANLYLWFNTIIVCDTSYLYSVRQTALIYTTCVSVAEQPRLTTELKKMAANKK